MDKLEELSSRIFPSDASKGQIGSIQYNVWLAQLFGVPVVGLKAESTRLRIALGIYGVLMTLVVTCSYTGFEIYDMILCWPNLDSLTQNICLSLTHIAGVFKVINIIYRLDEVAFVVRRVEYAAKTYVITKSQLVAFYRGEFENKIPLTIYASLVGFTGVLALIYLFYNPIDVAGKIFPYRVKLPEWMPFGIQLAYMGISVLVFALQIVAIDYLNVTMINQIRFQLKILNLAFEELQLDCVNAREQEAVNKRLQTIVEHHCLLHDLRNDVEHIFRLPVLLQFFTSLIIFAMTGFQAIVKVDNSNGAALIYCYCGCIFCELFVYCWFGNEVSEQSKTLSASGYGSHWYAFDQRFKKSLLIFMCNSQTPFVFTAGGFMSLSLPSFTGILSKSYTVIALLRQVYSR